MCGYPAPSREKGKSSSATITARTGVSRNNHEECVSWPAEISSTLNASFGSKLGLENQHINADCPMFVPTKAFYESSLAQYKEDDIAGTTKASGGVAGGGSETFIAQPIALAENTIGRKPENGGNHDGFTEGGPMYTLNATGVHGVAQPIAYALDSLASNSMKSANPVSGCNQVDVSKALDTSRGLDPSCNQGGMAVAQPIATHAVAFPWQSALDPIGKPTDLSGTLVKNQTMAVAVGTDLYNGNITGDVAATMGTPGSSSNASGPTVMQAMAVRRLTPVECERLQGFPDNYTDIKLKGKPTPDGPRYKALGNSMAVPVMAWIGKRIQEVEAINAP
jgi:hypothetical protein